jgi:hypothetical protein
MPNLANWHDNEHHVDRVVNVVPLNMPPRTTNLLFMHNIYWVTMNNDWLTTINGHGDWWLMNIYTKRDQPSIGADCPD